MPQGLERLSQRLSSDREGGAPIGLSPRVLSGSYTELDKVGEGQEGAAATAGGAPRGCSGGGCSGGGAVPQGEELAALGAGAGGVRRGQAQEGGGRLQAYQSPRMGLAAEAEQVGL